MEGSQPWQKNIDELRNDIVALEQKVNGDNDGVPKTVKKWGAILGIAAIVIALPHAIYDVYKDFHSAPKTRLSDNQSLLMVYNPKDKTIEFSFDLTIENTGNEDELIEVASARLVNTALPTNEYFIPFAGDDFVFFTDDKQYTIPVAIEKGKTQRISCHMSHKLGALSVRVTSNPGRLYLTAWLYGKNNKLYSREFCFDVNREVFQSTEEQRRSVKTTNCS